MKTESALFTLEIKGLYLPENVKEDISKALNEALMKKLGELDLAKRQGQLKGAIAAVGGGGIFANMLRPDGGDIDCIRSNMRDYLIRLNDSSVPTNSIGFNVSKNNNSIGG